MLPASGVVEKKGKQEERAGEKERERQKGVGLLKLHFTSKISTPKQEFKQRHEYWRETLMKITTKKN